MLLLDPVLPGHGMGRELAGIPPQQEVPAGKGRGRGKGSKSWARHMPVSACLQPPAQKKAVPKCPVPKCSWEAGMSWGHGQGPVQLPGGRCLHHLGWGKVSRFSQELPGQGGVGKVGWLKGTRWGWGHRQVMGKEAACQTGTTGRGTIRLQGTGKGKVLHHHLSQPVKVWVVTMACSFSGNRAGLWGRGRSFSCLVPKSVQDGKCSTMPLAGASPFRLGRKEEGMWWGSLEVPFHLGIMNKGIKCLFHRWGSRAGMPLPRWEASQAVLL